MFSWLPVCAAHEIEAQTHGRKMNSPSLNDHQPQSSPSKRGMKSPEIKQWNDLRTDTN
jgi:hypothetical protein